MDISVCSVFRRVIMVQCVVCKYKDNYRERVDEPLLSGCASGHVMEFINMRTEIKNKCNFCEYYKAMIENDKEIEKTKRYSVIVQSKTLINGKEKGTYNSSAFPLLFCSECGKKIK